MSKNNRGIVKVPARGPVTSKAEPTKKTALGAPGYKRDLQSELFLLAACNLPGEKAFHEGADERVKRFRNLIRDAAIAEPAWTAGLLGWLRGLGGLRLAPVEGAAEYAHARLGRGEDGAPSARTVVSSVLRRGDEPGEIVAYWMARYGRKMPIGFKRGVADGVLRLYTERALLKYDTAEAAVRFGDVIELVQPRYAGRAYGTWKDALYRHAIERRHGRDDPERNAVPERLATIRRYQAMMAVPVGERRAFVRTPEAAQVIRGAGVTWEALAGWLQGPMDAAAWEAMIPSMHPDALSRNLRNFDQAGVSDAVAAAVAAKLADPEEVAKSRMFPFRFLAAYRHAPSLRWSYPLEQGLGHSLANVPSLKGRTLVLVDRSPSMWDQEMSEHSDMSWADGAAVFGAAVALRAERADLVQFWGQDMGRGRNAVMPFAKGESVLKVVERFAGHRKEYGTDIPSAVRQHLRSDHDRVVIVTDEQTEPGYLPSNCLFDGGSAPALIDSLIPERVPLYLWNFGGYKRGATPSGHGNRHTLGGLTDSAFRIVPILESGHDAGWPWEDGAARMPAA